MALCKKCGEEISDHQFENYKGLCSQCARLTSFSSKESGKELIGWGFFILFVGIMFMFGGFMGLATNQPGLVVLLIIGILLFLVGACMITFGIKKTRSL